MTSLWSLTQARRASLPQRISDTLSLLSAERKAKAKLGTGLEAAKDEMARQGKGKSK